MWFTEWDQAKVGETTGTAIREFNIPVTAPSNANDIVNGPDGNLWLPTDNQGFVRVTPAGRAHRIEWLKEASQPSTLVDGPDGNLWFIEANGPCFQGQGYTSIGYINPTTHKVTEIPVDQGGNSFGITAGPDGRIWFADPQYGASCNSNGRIGAIGTTSTTPQYYYAPGSEENGFTPTSIVAGPDGNLYFGEYRSKIGRITPAGVITERALPPSPNGPWVAFAICVGPDGNIWFNDVSSGRLGRWKIN
jgi:virginiamycin B lyase